MHSGPLGLGESEHRAKRTAGVMRIGVRAAPLAVVGTRRDRAGAWTSEKPTRPWPDFRFSCKMARSCFFETQPVSDTAPPPTSALRDAAPMKALMKGQQTRGAILDAAVRLASQVGLEGLSIGALAEMTQMSKSGVFAHFGSREDLQISVIREYHTRFEDEVFAPAIGLARGLPRLRALFEGWVRRISVEIDSGCLYISGAVEFDDRPGPVRDALVAMVGDWQTALGRAIDMAVVEGHLDAGTDAQQMLFEVHGLILALHHDARFLRNPGSIERARTGFERLVTHYASKAPPSSRRARAATPSAAR
jgi:AcrR family transcriptional regulator